MSKKEDQGGSAGKMNEGNKKRGEDCRRWGGLEREGSEVGGGAGGGWWRDGSAVQGGGVRAAAAVVAAQGRRRERWYPRGRGKEWRLSRWQRQWHRAT